ncbi:hypothetical protein HG536_0A01710 [Torulaspora globosa]|uniref:Pre-mRNA-processing factor 19 n=1 Tax=Torulaspora globosa TaxID=48254 RepID=A0A7G3ZA18_9SACH|nr:uncharacterized protein HG536_0A01710 [Torulaspora globosa]QLL30354.1 hypothetical protein HG536_0A01710 [Torulaspora globosa]
MFCAISGKPPRFPVLSPRSKCIFEKELIEQYVSDEGKDPVTNSPLTVDELIEISQSPEQSSFADSLNSSTLNTNYSIPNLLSSLQNEWDAIMLENFKLRKQLDESTKKLSVAFYERDAAKIVAAKALKARDDIMREMNHLVSQIGDAEVPESLEHQGAPVSLSLVSSALLERLSQESMSYLKKTKKVASDFSVPALAPFKLEGKWDVDKSLKLHRTTSLCLEFQQSVVFQLQDVSQVCYMKGPLSHRVVGAPFSDKVKYLAAASHDRLLICTADGRMGVSSISGDQMEVANTKIGNIIFMENHEEILNDHFLWADDSGAVGFTTMDCKETILLIAGQQEKQFFQAAYHKDGLLLALVNTREIKIFDLTKPEEHSTDFQIGKEIKADGEIKEVRFSSNGYWMIVHCGNTLMAFDLRKSPGTLALNPFELGSGSTKVLWDLDVSARHLALLKEGNDSHQHALEFFSYQKSKKSWEPADLEVFHLESPNLPHEELNNFLMLYTKEGPAAILQAREQVLFYVTK